MNSETVVLLSTVSTGLLALMALCVKYTHASNCFIFRACWGCLYWEKDPSEHNRELAITHPVVPTSPAVAVNNLDNV